MTVLLAGPLVAATAWCLARLVVPRLRGSGCGPEDGGALGSWHVAMGASMAGMVLWSMTPAVAAAVAAVFVVGTAWSLLWPRRRRAPAGARGHGAHARLAVGCAAMVAMTLPIAAPASASGGMDHHHQHAAAASALAPPDTLVLLLLAALAVALLGRLGASLRPSLGGVARLDAACDAVMAGAMAWMLLLMVQA